MTPVADPAPGSAEERYNEAQKSARSCIERLNGTLKTRFRCILGERVLRYNPQKVGRIVIACAVLHNMGVAARFDEIQHGQFNLGGHENGNNPAPRGGGNAQNLVNGLQARNAIIERYFAR